jgi:hypothetical protein
LQITAEERCFGHYLLVRRSLDDGLFTTLNCRSRSRHRNGCFEGPTAIRPIKLAGEQSVPLRPLEPPRHTTAE